MSTDHEPYESPSPSDRPRALVSLKKWVEAVASIGYELHDSKDVKLFRTESLRFRVLNPDAAVHLRPAAIASTAG